LPGSQFRFYQDLSSDSAVAAEGGL